jgi:N-acetylmuramoyl-L-alanine amidase
MRKVINHTDTNSILAILFFIILFIFNSTDQAWCQERTDDEDYKIRTVVIDPGHGGKDSGAKGKTSYEKDIVLAIGLKLGKYIEENIPDVKVVYTRVTDEFIPLYRRAEIANETDADLFISIHANGWSDAKSSGTETLVLGLHRSDENFEVAKRENSVILLEEDYTARYENFDPNSLESYIIFSLMQNIFDNQSISFAGRVQDQFRERARRKDRGVKRQGLLVLAQTAMPGVLIETGFITNPDEERYLNSHEGQDYMASAIYRAFREYKEDIESRKGTINIAKNDSDTNTSSAGQDVLILENKTENTFYYKVQISSASESIPPDEEIFTKFNNVEVFVNGGIYKYAVGSETEYTRIVEYSKTVKSYFPDAFIIAIENGRIIPVQEALQRTQNN